MIEYICIKDFKVKPIKLKNSSLIREIKIGKILKGEIVSNNLKLIDENGKILYSQKSNFITLAEFRNNRINEILDETN